VETKMLSDKGHFWRYKTKISENWDARIQEGKRFGVRRKGRRPA